MKGCNVILGWPLLFRRFSLTIFIFFCYMTGFSQHVPVMDQWLPPVLGGGETVLKVKVSGLSESQNNKVNVHWKGFMAGERSFSLDEQGCGVVKLDFCGTSRLHVSLAAINHTIEVIVNPGEEVEIQMDEKGKKVSFKGDYAELNQYIFARENESSCPIDVNKLKGMTGKEYVAYCKTLYDERVRDLNGKRKSLGEGGFRYETLETLIDCIRNVCSGYANFKVAYKDEPGRELPRVTCDDLKVLVPDLVDTGYDFMLLPEDVLYLFRYFKNEGQLSDCLGCDSGYLHDLYRTGSCARGLRENVPLKDKYLEQLKRVSPEVAIYFTRLNEKVKQEWQTHLGKDGYRIGKVPSLPEEEVLDSILAGYRGEVVFVDFWYVYCRSCLRAMKEMEEVKREFEKKGVRFVFITGAKMSPENRWLQMIPDMKGDHYRLTDETFRYLFDERFKMKGLPHYLIADKQGKIKYCYSGFMGCEKMREILNEELNK